MRVVRKKLMTTTNEEEIVSKENGDTTNCSTRVDEVEETDVLDGGGQRQQEAQ